MKLKFFILLFPAFLFAQKNNDIFDKMKAIDFRVKYIDSLANFIKEEISSGEFRVSHSIRTEKQNPLFYDTRILKNSNQIIRVCYRERKEKKFEDWHIYLLDSKIIYVEIINGKSKKNNVSKKEFYYEDEILIAHNLSNLNVDDEVDIFLKAKRISK